MKRKLFYLFAAIAVSSCQQAEMPVGGSAEIIFSCEPEQTTRTTLQGEGGELTDLWLFDYVDGELVQQIHQTNTDADFGEPSVTLSYGEHHIYFVASRGGSPVVDTDSRTIVFGSVRDTFWKDYAISVTSTTSQNRVVTLDRVVTRLRILFDDEVPATLETINVQFATWYAGLNYVTGAAINSVSKTHTIEVPAAYHGTIGQLTTSFYGFSDVSEWTTDVNITAIGSNGVIGQVTCNGVPFKRNRITQMEGNIFGSSGGMSIGLNNTWEDSYMSGW